MKSKILIVVSLSFLIFGCSELGKLKIYNDTSAEIVLTSSSIINFDREVYLPGQFFFRSWNIDTSLFSDDSKKVKMVYNGDHVFKDTLNFTIKAEDYKKYHVEPEAGSITIWNRSESQTIDEIYLSDDLIWDNNLISKTDSIDVNSQITWTVTPGIWNLKVVYDDQSDFIIESLLLILDENNFYEFDGINKVKNINEKSIKQIVFNTKQKIERN